MEAVERRSVALAEESAAITMANPHVGSVDARLSDRLIVALDVPTVEEAEKIVQTLDRAVSFYKVGLQLQYAEGGKGLEFASDLIQRGKSVFLDSKLYDIPETVELAVQNVARMGARFLTVHGTGKAIEGAVKGRGDSDLKILVVTLLTSMDAGDLEDMSGAKVTVHDFVLKRAERALGFGADGVIASGQEVHIIRRIAENRLIVTPGIRRDSDARHDHKRIATPNASISAGADHLVVGRPITQAAEPRRVAEEILAEIEVALSERNQPSTH